MNINGLIIKITTDFTEFDRVLFKASHQMDVLRYALIHWETLQYDGLSSVGRLAFNVARFVGFLPYEIYELLESCPGAFIHEFGDGYDRS